MKITNGTAMKRKARSENCRRAAVAETCKLFNVIPSNTSLTGRLLHDTKAFIVSVTIMLIASPLKSIPVFFVYN
jgi:hypothetical protein